MKKSISRASIVLGVFVLTLLVASTQEPVKGTIVPINQGTLPLSLRAVGIQ